MRPTPAAVAAARRRKAGCLRRRRRRRLLWRRPLQRRRARHQVRGSGWGNVDDSHHTTRAVAAALDASIPL
jgi:hypothetical protein